MKTLALIPARAGSKGVPGKNTRDFCGKPLLQWAVEIGLATCDAALLSTDITVGVLPWIPYGCAILPRPPQLAQDDTPMLPVVEHALSHHRPRPDAVVLLQPTQPLRTVWHVKQAIQMLEMSDADSVVSVVETPLHYHPSWATFIASGQLEPWIRLTFPKLETRRQDLTKCYHRDGTVYAIRAKTIENGSLYGNKCLPLIIPSDESVNIDTEEDWRRAESLFSPHTQKLVSHG